MSCNVPKDIPCPTINAPAGGNVSLSTTNMGSGISLLYLNPKSEGCASIALYPTVVIQPKDGPSVSVPVVTGSSFTYYFIIPPGSALTLGDANLVFKPIVPTCSTTIWPVRLVA